MARILIVDDDPVTCKFVESLVSGSDRRLPSRRCEPAFDYISKPFNITEVSRAPPIRPLRF